MYYSELSPKMAMKIGKEYESKKVNRKNIERFAEETGLGVAGVRNRFVEIAHRVQDKLPEIEGDYSGISDLVSLVEERITRLMEIIKKE